MVSQNSLKIHSVFFSELLPNFLECILFKFEHLFTKLIVQFSVFQ